jgi:hypothetical protein
MTKHRNNDEATSLVKGGQAAFAGGVLALCQQVLGDPVAVFGLGMFGAIVPVLIDYGTRTLSLNESRRIDDVALYTLREIERHLSEGHEPRTDGFLDISPDVRSLGQELCEGILEITRTEHQEAKLPYIGHLYASILFTDKVSSDEANRLFRLLDSLTYRQLCILASFSGECEGLRTSCLDHQCGSDELASVMQECFELEGWGLLSQVNYDQAPFYGPPSWLHVVPANVRVSAYGMRLVALAGLSEVPKKHIGAVREIMSL